MKRAKLTEEERKKHRHEMSEACRKKVLRFTLQFNPTTDKEAREWFERNGKSGAYLKRLILEDKARRTGEKGQHGKEVMGMWRLKFYKAYANDKRLKRMLAYLGKFNKAVP